MVHKAHRTLILADRAGAIRVAANAHPVTNPPISLIARELVICAVDDVDHRPGSRSRSWRRGDGNWPGLKRDVDDPMSMVATTRASPPPGYPGA